MFIRVQSGRKRGFTTFNVMNIETYNVAEGGGVQLTMTSGATHQIPTNLETVDNLVRQVRGATINALDPNKMADPETPTTTPETEISSHVAASASV